MHARRPQNAGPSTAPVRSATRRAASPPLRGERSMIMKQSYAARLAALAAAAVIGASGSALAQPAHFGHGGHAGGDVALAIAALKGQLNLNTSQQQMWDNAAASMRAAHQSARANLQ